MLIASTGTDAALIKCDTIVIGAGPVGLSRIFELGLLGLRAHVVDAMAQTGGQCIELYPDKPIHDIPTLPVCSGGGLSARLEQQIRLFAPQFHPGHTVTALERTADDRFRLQTSGGLVFDAGVVVIAGGLGAFAPRTLNLPEAAPLVGHTLHCKVTDPALFDGQDIVIAGGGDAALDWTLALIERARSVVQVHRTSSFRTAPASVARMQALCTFAAHAHRNNGASAHLQYTTTSPALHRRLGVRAAEGGDVVTPLQVAASAA